MADFEPLESVNTSQSNSSTQSPTTTQTQGPDSQTSSVHVQPTAQVLPDFITWNNVSESSNIQYDPDGLIVGVNSDIYETLIDGTPYDLYSLFADDNIINTLVIETNRYAQQLKDTHINVKHV